MYKRIKTDYSDENLAAIVITNQRVLYIVSEAHHAVKDKDCRNLRKSLHIVSKIGLERPIPLKYYYKCDRETHLAGQLAPKELHPEY